MATFDRTALQRVIAVINNKGGVGKSTICSNLGGILAANGWRVLVIDLDPQGNLGLDLSYYQTDRDDNGTSLSKTLMFGDELGIVKEVRKNLDVVPGGSAVELAGNALAAQFGQGGDAGAAIRLRLAAALAAVGDRYDVVLLDCPPGSDVVQTMAMAAARWILIPSKSDDASLEGLELTANRIDRVIDINPDVDLLGVINFASSSSAHKVREKFADKVVAKLGGEAARPAVFKAYVSHAEAAAEAVREKRILFHELETKVKSGEKWYEALKRGAKPESAGPTSAGSVAQSLFAVTQEFIARLAEKEAQAESEEAAHV